MTTIYIGPYLVIPPTPRQVAKHQRTCTNQCANPHIAPMAKFCANCGGEVVDQSVTVAVTTPLPLQALALKWTDYMHRPEHGQHHPGGDMWLPNQGGIGLYLARGAEDDFVPRPLASVDCAEMLEKAQVYYDAFLTALKADFGIEPTWETGIVAFS